MRGHLELVSFSKCMMYGGLKWIVQDILNSLTSEDPKIFGYQKLKFDIFYMSCIVNNFRYKFVQSISMKISPNKNGFDDLNAQEGF